MKFVVYLLLAIAHGISESKRALINQINNDPRSTWTAVEYPESVMTTEKMKSMLMPSSTVPSSKQVAEKTSVKTFVSPTSVPESFDARTKWSGLILPVRDQQQCGSCWAFSVAESTGDRAQIVANGVYESPFSPQFLISCIAGNCDGQLIETAWKFVERYGITLDTCNPYTSGGGQVSQCPSTCRNGSGLVGIQAKRWSYVDRSQLQDDLYNYGPLPVQFEVFEDFEVYGSGVYTHRTGKSVGAHAVILIGWGVENNTPYWLVQNSWGTGWGLSGFFKIVRGANECGIEDYGCTGYF